MSIYMKFFTGEEGRMPQEMFRHLCKQCAFNAECVEEQANILGYTFDKEECFNIPLIDMIGFEFPFEVYKTK